VSGSSLRTLEQVKMYSVPISDPRVSELITWYQRTLQRAIDVIWDNIEWKYRFPKLEKGGTSNSAQQVQGRVPAKGQVL